MINSIKAELRKLLTVRSTYFIFLIALVIVALVSGYGKGVKADVGDLHNTSFFVTQASNAVIIDGVLFAVVALLLFGHEYRYNTILYTLTSSNSRIKSLIAKFKVISIFSIIASIVIALFAVLCSIIGLDLAGKHLVTQSFPVLSVLWKCIFVGWGYSMFALIIATIVRSQVGSIVTYLLIPLVGENIIEGIFKSSANYLPFNSLQAVITNTMNESTHPASLAHNVIVTSIYIAVGMIVSFILFKRRDAN
jgi:ABC-type transport system involved in multi-copper enzyme maturation permease subunit